MTDATFAVHRATDGAERVAPATWLRAGLVAAVAAAVAVAAFDLLIAERVVDRAVAAESAPHVAAGVPGQLTRDAQHGGLVLAELLYALGTSLTLAGVAILLGPVHSAERRWAWLVAAGAWSLVVVPFAALPPLPPGVEATSGLGERRVVFALAVVLGVATALSAAWVRGRPGTTRLGRAAGTVGVIGAALLLALALPGGGGVADGADTFVRDFRLVSLAGQLILWGTLGLVGLVALRKAVR